MKTLKDADINNKTVLLRVDFNVTLEGGKVSEDFRMRAALPTIQYLLENGAAHIVIISHFGRPGGKRDSRYSLEPIAGHLSGVIGEEVDFTSGSIGGDVREYIDRSKDRIIVLENIRFYVGEESNNKIFARNLAKLADIFVQDAFGVCHRKHASVVGVTEFLPSYAGLLLEKEISVLSSILESPEKPFSAFIGGAKISTKMPVIEKFLGIADSVCLGGALANTALKAKGVAVGKSLVEEGMIERVKRIQLTDTKLHLPLDVKVSKDKAGALGFWVKGVGNVNNDEIILDIGPDTQDLFANIIRRSKTIIWNGPMGYIEARQFAEGTRRVAEEIAKVRDRAFTVIGGGDTYALLEELGVMDRIGFVSTGGGAMLEYLVQGTLPGIEALK